MNLTALALACVGALALSFGAGPAEAQEVKPKIDAIAVQLYQATTGTLSQNIAPPAKFTAWNTVIGEGDAREPATDLLVSVTLSIAQKEGNSTIPLQIKVADAKGKALASRRVTDMFFAKGRTVQALFVPDATCAGPITVEATMGREKKTTKVTLACGE